MLNGEINLEHILEGCRTGNRNSQRRLYEYFYGYAMSICLRYSKCREEALEILNDGFLKAFSRLDQYEASFPFKSWLRRILINSAIDYHRKTHALPLHLELTAVTDMAVDEMPTPHLSPDEDVLPILQQLSPAYRMVFNLYVMEGYKHEEIAEMLGISVGTSRSNLVRAKESLRVLVMKNKLYTLKMNLL